MKYTCALLAVADIRRSRQFYEQLFGLEVFQDYGRNLQFRGGLALQQDFDWLTGIEKEKVLQKPNNMELAFEESDFDGFLEKLAQHPEIDRLGDVIEHSWGQRVIRFYDPDGHGWMCQ